MAYGTLRTGLLHPVRQIRGFRSLVVRFRFAALALRFLCVALLRFQCVAIRFRVAAIYTILFHVPLYPLAPFALALSRSLRGWLRILTNVNSAINTSDTQIRHWDECAKERERPRQ